MSDANHTAEERQTEQRHVEQPEDNVVREGNRTWGDRATEIIIKLIPYLFISSGMYFVFGLLGWAPLPFGISLNLQVIMVLSGGLTGASIFSVVGYLVIKWHHSPSYVHLEEMDAKGHTTDNWTVTPQEWRKMEVRGEKTCPTRTTSGGDTVYLCREVNMDGNYVKPAGDLEDDGVPDDDQIVADVDKANLGTWIHTVVPMARNWRKLRGSMPALREDLGEKNVIEMAVSMEQSEHGGDAVESMFDKTLDDYEAIKSEQDETPTKSDVLGELGLTNETGQDGEPSGESDE